MALFNKRRKINDELYQRSLDLATEKEEKEKMAEKLYEQNFEIVVKNRTLSLLEELYKTSVKTLTPEEMAGAVAGLIRESLSLECAGILRLKKKSNELVPLAFSWSERFSQALVKSSVSLEKVPIPKVMENKFLSIALRAPNGASTHKISDVWSGVIPSNILNVISEESHVSTVLVVPLAIGDAALGVLLLGFNRDYDALNSFEKKSIQSFADPIGLLLYKAYLYKSLQKAYAVEKRAKEELQQLDKIKDQFLLTTQHDLRKPLTSAKWFLELMMGGALGKQNKKTLEGAQQVKETVESSIEQVNNFLDIAQFQMGKSAIQLSPGVDLLPIMDKVVSYVQRQAEEKEIILNFKRPESLPLISADAVKLRAAIVNIIDNAIKYTPHGHVDVEIRNSMPTGRQAKFHAYRQAGKIQNSILIVVRDTGIGIPPDKVKTLFENMFERTEQAKRTTSMGKGVGLYLSAQIIKGHNGKIWAESQGEGKGSTFYIELPISGK